MIHYTPKRNHRGELEKNADLYWYLSRVPRPTAAAHLDTGLSNVTKLRGEWKKMQSGPTRTSVILNQRNVKLGLHLMSTSQQELLAAIAFIDQQPKVIDALVAARQREVDVRLVTRPGQLTAPVHARLIAAGIPTSTVHNLHSKVVVSDRNALVSSANWTQFSSGRNWEMGIYTPELELVHEIREATLLTMSAAR